MATRPDLKTQTLDLLRNYERCGVSSLASNTIAKTLKVSSGLVIPVLSDLIRMGLVEYARNTEKAAQPQYKLVGGRTK